MKGQLALVDRGPFCPQRDCFVPCSAPGISCSCRPCHCRRCSLRRARARGRRGFAERPLIRFRSPAVQGRLFPTPTS